MIEAKNAVSQTLEQTQSRMNKHAGPFRNTFPSVIKWKNCSNAAAWEDPAFRPAVARAHPHYKDKHSRLIVSLTYYSPAEPAQCAALFSADYV